MSKADIALCAGVLLALLVMWHWQRSHPKFDLSDLVTGDNGKVSATKFIQTATWVIASWGFVTLTQDGKMTEWYMAAYLGLAYGVKVAKDVFAKPDKPLQ